MSRPGTVSLPDRIQHAFVAGVAALLTFPFVAGGVTLVFEVVGIPVDGEVTLAVAAGLSLFGAVALFALAPRESDDSVWNAIPSRQYDGRHAESGGLTRGEQERALEELQDREE